MFELILFFVFAIIVGIGLALLSRGIGFRTQRPDHYVGMDPAFDVRIHLNGPMICEGVLYGPLGRVSTRFVAKMHGSWEGNNGRLIEQFSYDSGTEQTREWDLLLKEDGSLEAKASDLIGIGKGVQCGSAMCLKYRIKLMESAGGHVLDATDWMYLLGNGTLVNRSQMRKFGIKVAELIATIRKADD